MARRRDGEARAARRRVATTAGVTRRQPAAGSRRAWLVGAILVATGLLAYAGVSRATRAVDAARLPALPDLSTQRRPIADHLRDADRRARSDPGSASVVGALCLAYHADLFYDQAERCYARAEQLSAGDWRWTYYRALAHGERGGSDALAAGMRRVVALAPDVGAAWLRLGEAEFKEGHYDRAEEAWRRAATSPEAERSPPEGSPVHVASPHVSSYAALGLSRVALSRGDAERARQILEPVTSSAPQFGPAFRLLADSYTRLGRTADAQRAVDRAGRLPPYAPYADPMVDALARESRSSTFLLRQAQEADLTANAAWAEYVMRRGLEFDPANPDVVFTLGRILRTVGRNDEALELFLRYQQLVPGDFQALGQIGNCLAALRRFEEAESYLRGALEHLDDAPTHYNLGLVMALVGRPVEAVAEYERALDRDANHVEARSNLAAMLVRQGKLDQASRQLERVLATDPENANAHTNLGLVLAQRGQVDRAAREFREALRISPQQAQAAEALKTLGR
jgi:tetratricopeptide (TPR) repeat protein